MSVLKMPISEKKINQRLAQISHQFRHLFNSPLLLGFLSFHSHGTTPQWNVPEEDRYELCGNPVERIVPIIGLLQRSNSIGVVSISYNGKMGLAIAADKTLFSGPEELEGVINNIISEIDEIGEINGGGEEDEMGLETS
ncbi:hypothetical protein Fcan01_18913 [Folsomia candida]|uniref:O-acyltransferase WSD1 C-terminal domain-containing protein n=1 Tax=Folsomia candida TaxID=158441 RepID=A0A226DLR1_FOLCA|nr:hypothetical protein Fcan01_18913 [Folsomia candida]